MNEEKIKKYLSVSEASELCGICPKTLRKYCDQEKIDHYKTICGNRKINRLSLLKMCNIIPNTKEISKIQIKNANSPIIK